MSPNPRLAVAADLGAIVGLTAAAYHEFTVLLGRPPIPVTEDYAPRIAAGQVWVIGEEDALAGLIVLETHPDHLMIFSVAVAPARQGKGLGVGLLHWAEARALAAGMGELRLYTNARMERNIAIYERFGFRVTGRRANPQRTGWVAVDMAKEVRSGSH